MIHMYISKWIFYILIISGDAPLDGLIIILRFASAWPAQQSCVSCCAMENSRMTKLRNPYTFFYSGLRTWVEINQRKRGYSIPAAESVMASHSRPVSLRCGNGIPWRKRNQFGFIQLNQLNNTENRESTTIGTTQNTPPTNNWQQIEANVITVCRVMYSLIKSKFKDFSILLWKWGSKLSRGGGLRQSCQIMFRYLLCVFHSHCCVTK